MHKFPTTKEIANNTTENVLKKLIGGLDANLEEAYQNMLQKNKTEELPAEPTTPRQKP